LKIAIGQLSRSDVYTRHNAKTLNTSRACKCSVCLHDQFIWHMDWTARRGILYKLSYISDGGGLLARGIMWTII